MTKLSELAFCKVSIHDKSKDAVLGYFNKTIFVNNHRHFLTMEGMQVGFGIRAFIICPKCKKRCNVLYTVNPYYLNGDGLFGKVLACRKCWNFNYLSQQTTKTKWEYELHKMLYYGMLVDSKFRLNNGFATQFPTKHNNISWHNYMKYYRQYKHYQDIAGNKWMKQIPASLKRYIKR
ncbi:hypothetical protein [Macrococcoides caseolyticum]|uniref:Uncharacterized protein n=1 Tax=Macrococcoides caseolyticum TaxID=69966 RepID=A0A855GY86_9STAP|nr:hypothetical protein [Macrococcus caseolyticus]PKE21707.1 hypothetical protein CW688_05990 [Macrococcus caseolyticus]PKE26902.1 hypothetical protein CW686_02990 [Macrococcus caseolyticus]PKE59536.1 hypothetical protein CW673_02470 [Macrococcus caseolyticus]PKE69922.1 hypothetical protein CW662_06395 [Macrococcus caseolyticus]PKE72344.1 hypothetical protein CW665_05875 [Macrococcus caseolyticus]